MALEKESAIIYVYYTFVFFGLQSSESVSVSCKMKNNFKNEEKEKII